MHRLSEWGPRVLWHFFFALIGAVGGLLIGLIGTGSSLVMMPALVLTFPLLFPEFDSLRLAVGTTVATMTVGALSAALTHFKQRNVDYNLIKLIWVPYVLGALAGPWVSRELPSGYLKAYLIVVITVLALRMLSKSERQRSQDKDYRHHRAEVGVVSFLITLASSVAGIASGMFMIPYLQRFQMTMFRIIGTSTTGAAIYSVSAVIGYLSSGWSTTHLPKGAVGFVYVPAFGVMALAMALAVPLGVHLARRMNDRLLRRIFALFLLAAAGAMLLQQP